MTEAERDFTARAIKFHAFEQRHQLFAVEVGGFSAWRVMRNFLFNAYQGYSPQVARVPRKWRVLLAIRAVIALCVVLLVGRRRHVLFKGAASALRFRIKGKWADPGIDPLIESGISALKLVELNSADFSMRMAGALHPGAIEPSIFGMFGRIFGWFQPVKGKQFFNQTAKLLSDEMGLCVSPAALNMRVSTVMWQARIYGLLLKRIKPKVVIVTDTGDYALRRACHINSIPFIELQHGIFDQFHPDAIPNNTAGTRESLLIPDLLLVKGAYWAGRLQGFWQGDVAIPVGSQAVDHWRAYRSSVCTAPRPKHIVVTSQGWAIPEMIDWLMESIRHAPVTTDWRMTIKLHPMYDKPEHFDVLADLGARVRILAGQEEPSVYELLATADLHLSISSACHFDAAAMGVRTAMIPLRNHDSLMYAINDGTIQLLDRPTDLWQLLDDDAPTPDEQDFCVSNYVERVTSVLQRKLGLSLV